MCIVHVETMLHWYPAWKLLQTLKGESNVLQLYPTINQKKVPYTVPNYKSIWIHVYIYIYYIYIPINNPVSLNFDPAPHLRAPWRPSLRWLRAHRRSWSLDPTHLAAGAAGHGISILVIDIECPDVITIVVISICIIGYIYITISLDISI